MMPLVIMDLDSKQIAGHSILADDLQHSFAEMESTSANKVSVKKESHLCQITQFSNNNGRFCDSNMALLPALSDEIAKPSISEAICSGCYIPICDRYLLKVANEFWHEHCLRCCFCGGSLESGPTCFVRDGKVFCKLDYKRIYGAKCCRCLLPLNASDLVIRSLNNVFHIGCFVCICCGNVLQKGDQYVYHEGQIVCRRDYLTLLQHSTSYDSDDARKGPKRPRTILTSSQRKAFKASFEISAKPCRKVREGLARETGLSVRVVQVWFQNQRAKMKKVQRKIEQQKLNPKRPKTTHAGSLREKKLSESNSDAKSELGEQSLSGSDDDDDVDEDNSSDGSLISSPTFSESDTAKTTGTPDLLNNSRNHGFDQDLSSNPIDRLYSMQNTYFNF